jgi:hypothetical protein
MTVVQRDRLLPCPSSKQEVLARKGLFGVKRLSILRLYVYVRPAHFSKVVTSTAGSLPRPSAQVQLFKCQSV